MPPPLTDIQQRVYDFIRLQIEATGRSPTVREIQSKFGYGSPHTPQFHIRSLIEAGYLTKGSGHRALKLAEEPPSQGLRLLGMVAAGSPIEAIEQHDQHLSLNGFSHENHFALKVRGDSMIEECIADGDHVVVRRQTTCEDGELVVARVGEDATLKRFFVDRKKNRVTLQPANSSMQPIHCRTDDVAIEGVVVGVVRLMGD